VGGGLWGGDWGGDWDGVGGIGGGVGIGGGGWGVGGGVWQQAVRSRGGSWVVGRWVGRRAPGAGGRAAFFRSHLPRPGASIGAAFRWQLMPPMHCALHARSALVWALFRAISYYLASLVTPRISCSSG
jgi:hypothetical protein